MFTGEAMNRPTDERRARVQARSDICQHPVDRRRAIESGIKGLVPGTISWEEHERAWEAYARRYGRAQSVKRIHERMGFSYAELTEFLGHEPKTWEPLK